MNTKAARKSSFLVGKIIEIAALFFANSSANFAVARQKMPIPVQILPTDRTAAARINQTSKGAA